MSGARPAQAAVAAGEVRSRPEDLGQDGRRPPELSVGCRYVRSVARPMPPLAPGGQRSPA